MRLTLKVRNLGFPLGAQRGEGTCTSMLFVARCPILSSLVVTFIHEKSGSKLEQRPHTREMRRQTFGT